MSLAAASSPTSSPSPSSSSIQQQQSAATASIILSPGYYRRQEREQQQHHTNLNTRQHISVLANACLGQPQPVSSTLVPSSIPHQWLNCTSVTRNSVESPPIEKMTNQSHKCVQQQRDQIDDNHQTPPIETSTPSSIATDETPQIDRWSRDFRSLIDDRDGVNLFRQYTVETGLDHLLNFYFACIGLKSTEIDVSTKKRSIVVIFKRFILNPKILELSKECQQHLIDVYKIQLNSSKSSSSLDTNRQNQQQLQFLDENTFNEAFNEIESRLSGAIYQNFLKSRIFLDYINKFDWTNNVQQPTAEIASCYKTDLNHQQSLQAKENHLSPQLSESLDDPEQEFVSESNNYVKRFDMPVIDETSEDGDSTVIEVVPKFSQQQQHSRIPQPQLRSLSSNKPNQPAASRERLHLQFYALENPPHPYHVNRHAQYSSVQYNSKKDSEIESISSSDSSFVCSRDRKSLLRNMSSSLSNKTLTQRFQRPPPQQMKNQLLPTENPDEFARRLIEKLNKVRSEQETDIKLSQALISFERAHSPSLPGSQHGGGSVQQREAGVGKNSTNNNQTSSKSNHRESGLGLALKNIDFSTLKNESGQAILDKHFAQVFETPNADSPSTSNQSSSAPYPHHTNPQQIIHPPPPLSPTPHFIAQFNSLSANNSVTIPAYVKFSNEEVPHKLTLIGPHITLLSFKQQIPTKRGIQEFFFKRQSSESEKLDCGSDSLWINIKDDHQTLPQLDGKIHARVELTN
ncbi:uncharacterized protein LOC124490193 [Dermatophagoides farinae]|uniref:uncharacterized protein LOC124490193 n=1 Tax=Dermatophagoides farinae TaxID=6954 RepID=UPI003F63A85E